ncbi:MAG: SpoIIIAH-like family protein [Candidatus Avoscillospira sp.]
MKTWKRNAIVATVLVLICAGVYLNWNANQGAPVDLTETLDASQVLDDATLTLAGDTGDAAAAASTDYFAQIRLTRQESRDSAVELLQETIAYEDGSESASAAVNTLDALVSDALAESQIESLVIAKGYADCVAYMSDEGISVAVSAPAEGLTEADVALIADIVTTQTDYTVADIHIIEVK